MKFCVLSCFPFNPFIDGRPCTLEINNIHYWATIMGGIHYSATAFDEGKYGVGYEFLDNYDVVLIGVNEGLIEIGLKVKKYAQTKVIVFVEPELERFTSFAPRDLQVKLIELLNIADAVAVQNAEIIPFLKVFTSKPVEFVGLPFPLKRVPELCPPVQKDQEVHLGSFMGTYLSRNGLANLAALLKIGLPGAVDLQHPAEKKYVEEFSKYLSLPPIRTFQSTSWDQFMVELNKSILGVHMDFRLTWGRFPIDCAAVGIPCIASPNFYTQKILFPRLCVQYQDIDQAAKLAKELLSSQSFYNEVTAYAKSKLPMFGPEETKQRLLNLLEKSFGG